jgi:uncharacterized damage-inducible protein DinB
MTMVAGKVRVSGAQSGRHLSRHRFTPDNTMHANDIRALLDYTFWARDRLLDAASALTPEQYAQPMGNSFSSVRDTIVHLYGADWIWIARLEGLESPGAFPKPESFPDLASVHTAWSEVERRYRAFGDALTDATVNRVIAFKTLSFGDATGQIGQVIQHVVNHGTYHRGQVTTMIRQLGAPAPKAMDLIFYYRDKQPA